MSKGTTFLAAQHSRYLGGKPDVRPEYCREIRIHLKRRSIKPLLAFLLSDFPSLGRIEAEKVGRDKWRFYTDRPMTEELVETIAAQASDRVALQPRSQSGAHLVLTTNMEFFERAHRGQRG